MQKGFDWEIEKLRRNSAGLQQLDDGTWIRRPSLFDFLVSKSRFSTATARRLDSPPAPVNLFDVVVLFATNLLSNVGFGPAFGMASVPDVVIQKYEGSFLSFIKGALGGDLQTLAGGPLFLMLGKYFKEYGPIYNLSFGPKSFLVISDPVMARHILRESSPEQYCKGILAEVLEPIMGQGLIPADPATWKVRRKKKQRMEFGYFEGRNLLRDCETGNEMVLTMFFFILGGVVLTYIFSFFDMYKQTG